MPRSGDGVYSLPPNTTAVPGQTIESAPYNTVNNDIANDLNTARPITAGGTGATNAADALSNLGGVGQANFLSAYAIGDFYETVRDISAVNGTWLRRNGTLYDSVDYPSLSALLPALPDGVTWDINPTGASQTLNAIAAGEDKFVAVGDGGVIYVSSDRQSWEPRSSGTTQSLRCVVYANGIFVAAGEAGALCVSPDADNWTASTFGSLDNPVALAICYGAGLFVIAGGDSLNQNTFWTSSDASSWSRTIVSGNGGLLSISYNGTRFVAGGQGFPATVFTSTTGLAPWTGTASTLNGIIRSVSNDGTTFVLAGDDGYISTTTNGTTIVPRASGTTVDLYGSAYSPGVGWMAVGNGGTVRISTNATAWSSSVTGSALSLRAVTYDPDEPSFYVIVGASGTSLEGQRTLPTQFRVPNDDSTYGWIKALEEGP